MEYTICAIKTYKSSLEGRKGGHSTCAITEVQSLMIVHNLCNNQSVSVLQYKTWCKNLKAFGRGKLCLEHRNQMQDVWTHRHKNGAAKLVLFTIYSWSHVLFLFLSLSVDIKKRKLQRSCIVAIVHWESRTMV